MTSSSASDAPPPGELARVLGLGGAILLGLGSILGTGVFVSLGIAAGVVGEALVPAVVVAALVATANGLSSAQLAAAHPVSGGTYEYGHRFIHPVAGFVAGWTFLAAKSASAATAALGSAGYLLHVLGVEVGTEGRVALAAVIASGVTALVAGGVRRSNAANAVLVSITIGALGAFVWVGLSTAGPVAVAASVTAAFDAVARLESGSFLRATALLFVAYTGYGRIATLGEEVRRPAETIPRAIIATLGVSMLLYVAVSATALASAGPAAFAEATRDGAAPLEAILRRLDRPVLALAVGVGAVTAMAGVLLNLLLGLSRVLLAMARRGEMPPAFSHVSAEGRSPVRAVWAVGGLATLLVLAGDVATTWSFSAFSVLVYYGLTNLAALRLPPPARRFPRWIAAAGMLACTGLAFFVEPAIWIAGLGSIGVGLVVRAWMLGRTAQA
jgi:APA family basic amino acid/polyamine antiporter